MNWIGGTNSGAIFDESRAYRYTLWRRWVPEARPAKMVAFIGLNPSTADEQVNDNTIRRCIDFAKTWKFDGMVMLNLFAFRATDPKHMKAQSDPIGPKNDDAIWIVTRDVGRVVCVWGAHGTHRERYFTVRSILRRSVNESWCFGRTDKGHPRHPLYLPKGTLLERYT